ncbi:hypothetical protein PSHT_15627 [Puccinia striiformis]|uniref:Uncharacterized protein n=1 Tax=Puccinia striiformis TaxID=27350 RepID=A0A2S4UDW1_9BASI|nr:hypothetical protein PSHT_15627 [Puccinia striiformis]
MDPVIMDKDMKSVLTDLSSELATNKDYPSTSELSEPPELNPISVEDDADSLTSEDEDYDYNSTNSSEEDVPLSSLIWTEKRRYFIKFLSKETYQILRSPINAHEHSTSAKNKELSNSTRQNKHTLKNLTNPPPTCGSVFRDVHVIKRDFFPNITTKTKEKKTQRRAARKFFKQFGGPAPSKEPIHPHNPTEAEISNAYTIVNDSKQFGLYSYGHVHIFNMRVQQFLLIPSPSS